MEPLSEPSIWQTLLLLFHTLGTLVIQLAALGYHLLLWILFAAWCLWGINWKRTRHFLATGAWAPAILLIVLIAIVWSRIDPSPCAQCGLPAFWWQLGYVSMLAALAMFCGWIQNVMHWTPHDISVDPPAHGHGHDHGHSPGHH
ncbi:MAG: hypothetical protein HYX68_13000 [Planctomycetes bacterium]|nr:hypothetical protein [Planctomycetota bacterium]